MNNQSLLPRNQEKLYRKTRKTSNQSLNQQSTTKLPRSDAKNSSNLNGQNLISKSLAMNYSDEENFDLETLLRKAKLGVDQYREDNISNILTSGGCSKEENDSNDQIKNHDNLLNKQNKSIQMQSGTCPCSSHVVNLEDRYIVISKKWFTQCIQHDMAEVWILNKDLYNEEVV